MINVNQKYAQHNSESEEQLKEIFEFKNKKAGIIINDVNYWLFGERQDDVPLGYCGEDPSIMMDYQMKKMERHHEHIKDDLYIPFLMPWYGTSVLASGFGVPVIFPEKMNPAVDMATVDSPEAIYKLEMPDPYKSGQMPRVLKTIDYFRENTDLPIGITDCQGPLTSAISVIGYEKFMYWLYDYPEAIHTLMDKVTTALIDWVKVQKKHMKKADTDSEYILGCKMPDGFGGVWISDDDAVIFSEDIYREFVVPYNSRMLTAFGGGGIHYCGTATQHIDSYLATEGLTCLHNMNLDHLDNAVKMKKALSKKGIVYIASDFVTADDRMESYYKEFFEAIEDDGQEGLLVVPYPAPAIALKQGKYQEADRDQLQMGIDINRIIRKYM